LRFSDQRTTVVIRALLAHPAAAAGSAVTSSPASADICDRCVSATV
jgi:hypothetical protein